ncbi:lipoyl synthase [Pseudomonadales bacterium]|jgi:lipoic acid synthetase|nr:lipoyl synthase [Gammaproteobacteria bacterium]MDA7725769.1 lipoyl synthase [Pseudomonadales bacterium]MDA7771776.1 lipoyl synthase [Pseudomonadales bacterium]MDA8880658.1 lipoyl synthase [Pseudomonadales bacterium]MDC1017691.1 lipoyl synthase [Pseudomonadales bacterium]|tara:strand:+ start:9520 stop:10479 length:960 start_codon:yes stop_codon:yes gene_type:complete
MARDIRNKLVEGEKHRGADKVRRIPVKVIPSEAVLRKPDWIRVRIPASSEVGRIKNILRTRKLASVCEEASCPNISECFSHGTATFMIMGEICTRRCPFCDVAHGKPLALDEDEPRQLAEAVAEMKLKYVVVTSVDRDDLKDSGAGHFADCISELRIHNPDTRVEVLVPDFRGRMEIALEILSNCPPDVFNHNLETVPRLYKKARPGADYQWSLSLLKQYKQLNPSVLTKSGLMLGLGETLDEVREVMRDMRDHDVDMVTLGQYLQPSRDHLALERYVHPDEFAELARDAKALGFSHVASGPLVRSSYHADLQAKGEFG